MIATTREGHQIYSTDHNMRNAIKAAQPDSLCGQCVFLGDLCQTQQREHAAGVVSGIKRKWVATCAGYAEQI